MRTARPIKPEVYEDCETFFNHMDAFEQLRRERVAQQQKPGVELHITAAGAIFWICYAAILVGLAIYKIR